MARVPLIRDRIPTGPTVLSVRSLGLSEDQFDRICRDNPELHIELSARKELLIMTLPGGKTGRRNDIICRRLGDWAERTHSGPTFSPMTLFTLPDGSRRAPDASWIRWERWNALTDSEQEGPPPLAPDFVIELMSSTDRRPMLESKMGEYITNGVRLGWLVDPFERRVDVYRSRVPVIRLDDPEAMSGAGELPVFELRMVEVW